MQNPEYIQQRILYWYDRQGPLNRGANKYLALLEGISALIPRDKLAEYKTSVQEYVDLVQDAVVYMRKLSKILKNAHARSRGKTWATTLDPAKYAITLRDLAWESDVLQTALDRAERRLYDDYERGVMKYLPGNNPRNWADFFVSFDKALKDGILAVKAHANEGIGLPSGKVARNLLDDVVKVQRKLAKNLRLLPKPLNEYPSLKKMLISVDALEKCLQAAVRKDSGRFLQFYVMYKRMDAVIERKDVPMPIFRTLASEARSAYLDLKEFVDLANG